MDQNRTIRSSRIRGWILCYWISDKKRQRDSLRKCLQPQPIQENNNEIREDNDNEKLNDNNPEDDSNSNVDGSEVIPANFQNNDDGNTPEVNCNYTTFENQVPLDIALWLKHISDSMIKYLYYKK